MTDEVNVATVLSKHQHRAAMRQLLSARGTARRSCRAALRSAERGEARRRKIWPRLMRRADMCGICIRQLNARNLENGGSVGDKREARPFYVNAEESVVSCGRKAALPEHRAQARNIGNRADNLGI